MGYDCCSICGHGVNFLILKACIICDEEQYKDENCEKLNLICDCTKQCEKYYNKQLCGKHYDENFNTEEYLKKKWEAIESSKDIKMCDCLDAICSNCMEDMNKNMQDHLYYKEEYENMKNKVKELEIKNEMLEKEHGDYRAEYLFIDICETLEKLKQEEKTKNIIIRSILLVLEDYLGTEKYNSFNCEVSFKKMKKNLKNNLSLNI